jgi:alkanesulfonate monooxygenase SsuD/methylene tetrahydromethanopterin reductase-like flavin-dependent oxidoreductase (luciferase family)
LDTSTLLTYASSRTERIAFSANVASLPLRPPLSLARGAATLDALSGGRFRLGLGAGAFWDGIARMGGRRLTPGQGVDALAEAIELIREAWDTDKPNPIHYDGRYYRAEAADRGPRPAHKIPIWVGAYKPRMLELTGRLGDGWLPTIEYVENGMRGLAESNARIDDAAAAAGRQPGEVRRLMNFMRVSMSPTVQGMLNAPPDAWVDQIAAMALQHGLSAFLIGGDDPNVIARFGAEVAPAVRELVARERRDTGGKPPIDQFVRTET